MAHLSGRITIDAPPQVVFDTVADTRNEPTFNPSMREVELLTPPPIGEGTRFRALMGRGGTPLDIEVTEFERPHRLGSRTTSSLMSTSGALTVTAVGDGTLLEWDWQVEPRGWLRLWGPLFGPIASRVEHGIWAGLKRHLETARPGGSA